MVDYRSIKLDVLYLVLRPLVRFCLRHSHSFQDLVNTAKRAFILLAQEEIGRASDKINVSRISILTGIHRAEIRRVLEQKEPETSEPPSVLGKVILRWRHDPRFVTKPGEPRELGYKGCDSDFTQLVESVSTALKPGTVLFELERAGYVERSQAQVALLRESFTFQSDPRKAFELLAKDIDALIVAVEQNILKQQVISNLHLHTAFDNVFQKDIPKIRRWLLNEGKKFHKRARTYISRYDKDINPAAEEELAGAGVVLSAFSITTQPDQN